MRTAMNRIYMSRGNDKISYLNKFIRDLIKSRDMMKCQLDFINSIVNFGDLIKFVQWFSEMIKNGNINQLW